MYVHPTPRGLGIAFAFAALTAFADSSSALTIETFAGIDPGTVVCGTLPSGGTVTESYFPDFELSVANHGVGSNSVVIFDSIDPTFWDPDLGTPNENCDPSGPGEGEGGLPGTAGENCEPLGNLIVIAQNIRDDDSDGLVDLPNDERSGGVITFDFVEAVSLDFVTLVDIDNESAFVRLFGPTGESTVFASDLGDNSVQTLDLSGAGTAGSMEIHLGGSGGVAQIGYSVETPLPTTLMTWGAVKGRFRK